MHLLSMQPLDREPASAGRSIVFWVLLCQQLVNGVVFLFLFLFLFFPSLLTVNAQLCPVIKKKKKKKKKNSLISSCFVYVCDAIRVHQYLSATFCIVVISDFKQTDNNTCISVLVNLKYTGTSHPISMCRQ